MKWLIKILGGFTKEDLDKAKADTIADLKGDIDKSIELIKENNKLKSEINSLKKENLKLNNRLTALDNNLSDKPKVSGIIVAKPSLNETTDKEDNEKPLISSSSTKYYMIIQAKDYYYRFEDEEYINVFKAPKEGIGNCIRAVCQSFTKRTGKERVKFTEFNDEYTYMYKNRFNEDVVRKEDSYELINAQTYFHRIDLLNDTRNHYEYKNGILCFKDGFAVYEEYR